MGRTTRLTTIGLLAAAATAYPRGPIPLYRRQNETGTIGTTHDDLVRPSPYIDWQPCHQDTSENLQCTWLTVPLDYENPEVGTADIAFIRYFLSEDAEDLYYNPGGPGESGVEAIVSSGQTWSKQWGMNLVSFDPRSVGKSDPKIVCPSQGNGTLGRRQEDSIILGDLKGKWEQSLKFNTECAEYNKNSEMKYIGTSAVVQDMMHFVELQAALRDKDPASAHINYFGTSYGTGVGQTLVALYPERVRRALLDGNIYAVAHYQGWEPNGIDDFAHGIWLFSKLCFEAGPEWCPLAEGMESIDEVQARFDAGLLALASSPIFCSEELPKLDHNDMLNQVSQWMYAARNDYPKIVNLTLDIEAAVVTGDNSTVCAVFSGDATASKIKKREEDPDSPHVLLITSVDVAGRYPWRTYEEWKAAAERLEATSQYGAFNYATGNGFNGLGFWDIVPPPSQYVDHFENGTIYETPYPVLFVNTPGDPVTPMSSAYQMSKLFAGSSVFIVDTPGHGYQNAPSKCAADIIATYFAEGTVPESGLWCKTDVEPNYYFGAPLPNNEAQDA